MSRIAVHRILAALALVACSTLFGAMRPAMAWIVPGCTQPLASLDPQSLGLDPTQAVQETAVPFKSYRASNSYVFHFPTSGKPLRMVGVVLPAPGPEIYTIAPSASFTINRSYDVSGCWGPHGAVVQAQPGVYTFLAVATDGTLFSASLSVGVYDGANLACGATNEKLGMAPAKQYAPLAPTVKGRRSGLMIGSIVAAPNNGDGYITVSDQNLGAQGIKAKQINDAAGIALNIDTLWKLNKAPITAGEIGHGQPNCWYNVNEDGQKSSFGTDAKGDPSRDLATLVKGNAGKVAKFDIFSCDVAFGAVDKTGNPVANHLMTQLATKLTGKQDGDSVTVRAVNVVIKAVELSQLHPKGAWLIGTLSEEEVDTKPAGTQVEMTCANTKGKVTCAAVRTQLYP